MRITSKEQLQGIELKAAAMLKKIRKSESHYPKNRPTYYVDSKTGCDKFDGKFVPFQNNDESLEKLF